MNIKFKMPHWGRNIKLKGMAKEIFMTVIATTISIVLTFGTAAWQDKCKKDELRRQMAMMVINDVDKTISVVEKMLALEDAGFNATRYVRDHIDNFEKISQDSVNMFLSYISNLVISTDVEFNISNEHIFNSSQESWNTLENIPFIENVQSIYHIRSLLKKAIATHYLFRKPISDDEIYQFVMVDNVFKDKNSLKAFCEKWINDQRIASYLNYNYDRRELFKKTIYEIRNLNESNQFLMNITDDDMKEFVNKTIKQVHTPEEQEVIGRWVQANDEERIDDYEFFKDHSLKYQSVALFPHPAYYGKIAITANLEGKWSLEDDSLIIVVDPQTVKIVVNDKNISYRKEVADSVKAIVQNLRSDKVREQYVMSVRETPVMTRAINIDVSGKNMELIARDSTITHYKLME